MSEVANAERAVTYQCSKCGAAIYFPGTETTTVCPACGTVNEKRKPVTLDFFTYGGDGSRRKARESFVVPEVTALDVGELILPKTTERAKISAPSKVRNFAENAAIADDKIAKILSDRFTDEERTRDAEELRGIDPKNVYSEFFLNFQSGNTKKYINVLNRADALNESFADFALGYALSLGKRYDLSQSLTLLSFIKDCSFFSKPKRLSYLRTLGQSLAPSTFTAPDAFSYAHALMSFTGDDAEDFGLAREFLIETKYAAATDLAEALLFFDTYAKEFPPAEAARFLNAVSYQHLSALELEKFLRYLVETGRATKKFASEIFLRYLRYQKEIKKGYGETTTSRFLLLANHLSERDENFSEAAGLLSELFAPKGEKSFIDVVSVIFSDALSIPRQNAAFDCFQKFEPESTKAILMLLQILDASEYPDKFRVFDFYIRSIVYLKEYDEIARFLFFLKASATGSPAAKDGWYATIFETRMKNCAIEKLYVLLELYNIFQSEVLKCGFSFETIVTMYQNDPVFFNKKQLALWREEKKISDSQYRLALLAMKKFIRYAFKNQSQIDATLKELDAELQTLPPFPADVEKKMKRQLRWLGGKPCLDERSANAKTEPYLFELLSEKQLKYTGELDAKRAVSKRDLNEKSEKRSNLAGWLVAIFFSAPAVAAGLSFMYFSDEIVGLLSPLLLLTSLVLIGLLPICGAAVSYYFRRFLHEKRYLLQWTLRLIVTLAAIAFFAYECYTMIRGTSDIYPNYFLFSLKNWVF